MEYSKILAQLRIKNGLTQREVADKMTQSGFTISNVTVSKLEIGLRLPDMAEFLELCKIYKVEDIMQTFTEVSSMKDDLLAGLNHTGRKHAKEYIDFLRQAAMFTATQPPRIQHRYMKLCDLPVSAGIGEFLDSSSYTEIQVDDTVPASAEYALRISGDSMTPRFIDRQIVFIKPQDYLDPGEIGIFAYENEGYIKKFGGDKLISLNSQYKPIIIRDWDSFRIFGKVVGG